MRLLLAITSEEGRELGHRARHEFGEEGGAIGRNAACAWALPDPTNVLSARHAAISFNGRGFEIADTSTNGVYLNTVKAPIGRGASAFLSDGDTLYLGPFEISVTIVEDAMEERRRLGVGPAAIALKSEPPLPPRGDAPSPTRTRVFVESALSGLGDAPSPRPAGPRLPIPPADRGTAEPPSQPEPFAPALSASSAPNGFPSDLASLGRDEPTASPVAPSAAAPAQPARPVIPAEMFADILGPAAVTKGPAQAAPAAEGFASPLAAPRANPDPLGFGAPQGAGAGRRPLIPDTFDFSDLLAPSPAPRPSAPVAAASPLDLPPIQPVAAPRPPERTILPPQAPLPPEAAALQPAQTEPPPRPAALSPSLSADLISLRAPGAAPAPGSRALDPIVVLRQRAAGQGRQSSADASPPAAPPAAPGMTSSMPLPLATADRGGAAAPEGAQQARLAEAFWNGLGVDAKGTPPERQAELLAECGRALREAVVGLAPTLAARRSMKDELRIDQTRLQPRENNPLKFFPSAEAVLKALVGKELEGFLPLSQALREGLNDIKAHEVATLVALDAVVKTMLARFDPAGIEAQGGAPSKLFGRGPDKSRLWDNFARLHATLASNLEETTRKLVGEEFARAYAQQVETFRRGSK